MALRKIIYKNAFKLPYILEGHRHCPQLPGNSGTWHWCVPPPSVSGSSQAPLIKDRELVLGGRCKGRRQPQGHATYLVLFPPDDLRRDLNLVHVLMEGVSRLLTDDFQKHFVGKENKVSVGCAVDTTKYRK